jgi:FkbM family methyltransferase
MGASTFLARSLLWELKDSFWATGATMSFGKRIRIAMYHWHCFIARGEMATRFYIFALSAIARCMPSRRIRDLMEWSVTGQQVPWKPLAFPSRKVVVGNRTQIRLKPHLGEFDQAALFRSRLDYEGSGFTWLERHAPDRYDAVIDIGANVGIYSIFFNALIAHAPASRLRKVYAFEPSRTAYFRLLANLEANDACSVEAFAVAVSDESGFSQFYEPEGHLVNGSLSPAFAEQFSHSIADNTVVTIAGSELGKLFARHQRVLLKIDAEGLEPRILTAMATILERHRPDLLIEVLQGVDVQLNAADWVAAYACFHLTAEGPSRREALTADPLHRDWLLTTSPYQLDEANP